MRDAILNSNSTGVGCSGTELMEFVIQEIKQFLISIFLISSKLL